VFTSKATPRFLAILVLSSVLLTGCAARSIPETKPPATPQAGVIDMDKAIKAHPKYQEWQKLKQQAATLNEQLAVEANRTAGAAQSLPALNMPGTAPDGLKQAIEQEYNAKMAAKQQELQARLAAKAQKIHGELSSELQAYAEQLDKKYQPRIFNLQLKLQTVRMDEKEAAAIKQEIDNVKAERADKLAAREKELAQNLDNALNPEKPLSSKNLPHMPNSSMPSLIIKWLPSQPQWLPGRRRRPRRRLRLLTALSKSLP